MLSIFPFIRWVFDFHHHRQYSPNLKYLLLESICKNLKMKTVVSSIRRSVPPSQGIPLLIKEHYRGLWYQWRWSMRYDRSRQVAGRLLPGHEQKVPAYSDWYRFLHAGGGSKQNRQGFSGGLRSFYSSIFLQPYPLMIIQQIYFKINCLLIFFGRIFWFFK